ncbi:MAG: C1 family peptidase [Gaiellaceae bacterium]
MFQIKEFPNATVAEYGTYIDADVFAIMAEILARGPVAASINGKAIHNYESGIISDMSLKDMETTHAVSIIGWDADPLTNTSHLIVRNSWGQYFGEMGYFRVVMGHNLLGIESRIAWATPGVYTEWNDVHCHEDGGNCKRSFVTCEYVDPSRDIAATRRRISDS